MKRLAHIVQCWWYGRRVKRGIALLRKMFPGSIERMRVPYIDLNSAISCPLGQASGRDWSFARDQIGITHEDAIYKYGFEAPYADSQNRQVLAYVWQKKIKALQAA